MTFTDFCDDHSQGTYVNMKLSEDSNLELQKFLRERNIPSDDPAGFHCTIVYSRKPCPDCKFYQFNLPIFARVDKWEVFPTQKGGQCLVLKLECPEMIQAHEDIRNAYGATHDYPEYKPHVTICYDYNKEAYPSPIIENFWLTFNVAEVKGLDPDFKPGES